MLELNITEKQMQTLQDARDIILELEEDCYDFDLGYFLGFDYDDYVNLESSLGQLLVKLNNFYTSKLQ